MSMTLLEWAEVCSGVFSRRVQSGAATRQSILHDAVCMFRQMAEAKRAAAASKAAAAASGRAAGGGGARATSSLSSSSSSGCAIET